MQNSTQLISPNNKSVLHQSSSDDSTLEDYRSNRKLHDELHDDLTHDIKVRDYFYTQLHDELHDELYNKLKPGKCMTIRILVLFVVCTLFIFGLYIILNKWLISRRLQNINNIQAIGEPLRLRI